MMARQSRALSDCNENDKVGHGSRLMGNLLVSRGTSIHVKFAVLLLIYQIHLVKLVENKLVSPD